MKILVADSYGISDIWEKRQEEEFVDLSERTPKGKPKRLPRKPTGLKVRILMVLLAELILKWIVVIKKWNDHLQDDVMQFDVVVGGICYENHWTLVVSGLESL